MRQVVANRRLLTLWLGHFTVDSYVGVLPVLYPLLIQRFQLSLETVGLLTLAYTGVASVSQPFSAGSRTVMGPVSRAWLWPGLRSRTPRLGSPPAFPRWSPWRRRPVLAPAPSTRSARST